MILIMLPGRFSFHNSMGKYTFKGLFLKNDFINLSSLASHKKWLSLQEHEAGAIHFLSGHFFSVGNTIDGPTRNRRLHRNPEPPAGIGTRTDKQLQAEVGKFVGGSQQGKCITAKDRPATGH
jgi:hypothetical protein